MGARSAARNVPASQPAAEQPGHCMTAIKLPGHPQPPTMCRSQVHHQQRDGALRRPERLRAKEVNFQLHGSPVV